MKVEYSTLVYQRVILSILYERVEVGREERESKGAEKRVNECPRFALPSIWVHQTM